MLRQIMRCCTAGWRCLTVVLITGCACSFAAAQQPAANPDSAGTRPIAELIEAARSGFSTPKADEKQAILVQLRAAVRRLSDYLDPGGKNGRAWKRYLEWPQLEAAIADGSTADSAELAARLRPFQRGYVGLELPIFSDVADGLDRLATYKRQVEDADLATKYDQRLDTIAAALSDADNKGTVLNPSAAEAVDWLARHGQASALVAAIHKRYRRENVLLRVDGDVVRAAMDRDVDETTPVNDNILGTRVRGTSQTTGRLTSELVPSDDEALLDLDFAGTSKSLTTGYNGPARIRSAGTTTLDAHTRLTVNASGLNAAPVETDAETKTKTLSVGSKRGGLLGRFIARIARKKVAERKGASERVAADHAADQFSERMDGRLADLATRVNDYYFNKLRHPLADQRSFPDVLRLTTTSTELLAVVLAGRRDQFAAPTAPPAGFDDADLELRLHESAINNLASSMLSDRELTNEDFRRILTDLLGENADRLLSSATEGDEPGASWGIKFAALRPLSVHFSDGQFDIQIRGDRFLSHGKSYSAMDITAHYQLVADGDSIKAVRQGDLDILPPGFKPGQRLKIRQITLKQLLERRMNKLLKPEIVPQGIELTGQLSGVGKLRLAHLVSQDGWLAAGWQRETPEESTARSEASSRSLVQTAAGR